MNISVASRRSGLPAKTIRYYEEIGLLQPDRSGNGYRDYSETDVHRLRFLQRSRSLGFSVEECRLLLSLYGDQRRESADVKEIAEAKLAEVERKIAELVGLRDTLSHLIHCCHGDSRPDCPILDELSGTPPAAVAGSSSTRESGPSPEESGHSHFDSER
ncbi:MAG: Cu(I)-responsive transcriptional regulator [Rhizobiaceae bacterium]|nr:Cu(I)-responsive transcriptional regulator [Rhizobiaceae bacterium]